MLYEVITNNEILIKIIATSVTASDCIVRRLNLSFVQKIPAVLPFGFTKPRKSILGLVLSGIVEDIGEKVTEFKIGEKVFAHSFMRFGSYAEYICLPTNSKLVSQINTGMEFL